MTNVVVCAVPGCDNELSDGQKNKKISVCSSCESAQMHKCEACGMKISPERIRNGATLCKECEMNPNDLEGVESEMRGYDAGFDSEFEDEDYMT